MLAMVGIAAGEHLFSTLWTPLEDRSDWVSGFPGVTPGLTRDRFVFDSNGNWLPNGLRPEIEKKPSLSIDWDPAKAPDWTRGYSRISPSYPSPFFRVR